jgi:hypothetical protein
MFSYFKWRREIADVTAALNNLLDLLANAERSGGFERAAAILQQLVGRNQRNDKTPDVERGIVVTTVLPNHDFEVALKEKRGGVCYVTITGLSRYAGFWLSCALPSRRLVVDLYSDRPNGFVAWRARKLVVAVREDKRARAV